MRGEKVRYRLYSSLNLFPKNQMKRIWLSTGALSAESWLWRVTLTLTVLITLGTLGWVDWLQIMSHDLPRPPLIAATLA